MRMTSSRNRRSALNRPATTSALQRAIRCGHDADVDLAGVILADSPHLAFLQHAQQLRLGAGGELADLVEEERALIGVLEEAWPLNDRAGERAPRVAEQLGFEQVVGDAPRS